MGDKFCFRSFIQDQFGAEKHDNINTTTIPTTTTATTTTNITGCNTNNNNSNNNNNSTVIKINMGTEHKTVVLPKNTSFKDITQTIKDSFGLSSKSVLNIKYENSNGNMLNMASECHLKRANRDMNNNTIAGDDSELRLVVKEVQPCTSTFFSFFGFGSEQQQNTSINTNIPKSSEIPNNNSNSGHSYLTQGNVNSNNNNNHNSHNNSINNSTLIDTPSFVSHAPSAAISTGGGLQQAPSFLMKEPVNSNNIEEMVHHSGGNSLHRGVNSHLHQLQTHFQHKMVHFRDGHPNGHNMSIHQPHHHAIPNHHHHHHHHHPNHTHHHGVHHHGSTHGFGEGVSPLFKSQMSFTPLLSQISNSFSNLTLGQQFSSTNKQQVEQQQSNQQQQHIEQQQQQQQQQFNQLQQQQPIEQQQQLDSTRQNDHHSLPISIPQANVSLSSRSPSSPSTTTNYTTSPKISTPTTTQQSKFTSMFATPNTILPNPLSINKHTELLNKSKSTNINTNIEQQQQAQSQPQSNDNGVKLIRNESFEFSMGFDDSEEDTSVSSITSSVSSDTNCSSSNNPVCNDKPDSSFGSCIGNICDNKVGAEKERCQREVAEFIQTVTNMFCSLRLTNDSEQQKSIKNKICEMIQSKRLKMPWILNVFPQLGRFASQMSPISVPPNTPPPSPSSSPIQEKLINHQQHITPNMTINNGSGNNTTDQATIYRVPGDIPLSQIETHIKLQNSIESSMAHHSPDAKLSSGSCSSSGNTAGKPSCGIGKLLPLKGTAKLEGPTIHRGTTCYLCQQSPIVGNLYYCSFCTVLTFCEHCRVKKSIVSCPNQLTNNNQDPQQPQQHHNLITVSKALKSCNLNSQNLNVSPKRGCPYSRKKLKCAFNVKFISDVTLPFGSVAHPNQELVKTWRIQNVGSHLPKDCILVRVCGNIHLSKKITVALPAIPAGEFIDISIPIFVPNIISPICQVFQGGEYWRICTADGYYFGDQFWIGLTIKNDSTIDNNHHQQQHSNYIDDTSLMICEDDNN